MGTRRALIVQLLGLVLATALLMTGFLRVSREHELAAAQQELVDTDRIIAAQVEHEFTTMLSVLEAAADSVGDRLLAGAIPADEASERIATMKAGLPLAEGMIITDAAGRVRAGSDTDRIGDFDVSDRSYFGRLRHKLDTIDISEPLRTRTTGNLSFVVARRIEQHGLFTGVAAVAVRPDRIGQFFGQVRMVPDAKLSVIRLDGTLLFRVPDGHVGARVSPLWSQAGHSGSARFISALDGVERIAAYRVLPNIPAAVVVSRDVADVLARWRTRSALAMASAALVLSIVIPLWIYARHQLLSRRAAVLALQNSESQLRAILDASPFPVLVSALETGAIHLRNERAETLFGPEGSAVGLFDSDRFADDRERRALRASLWQTGAIHDAEARLIDRNGRVFWALVSATVVRNDGRDLSIVAVNDISARKESEEEVEAARAEAEASLRDLTLAQQHLVQSERLASLGTLVAGIAHEVNTPIGIALTTGTYISDTLTRFVEQAAVGQVRRSDFDDFTQLQREASDLLVANVRRAAELIQSFKRMSTDQASDARRTFDLRQAIDDTVFSLTPSWKRAGHRIEVHCAPGIEVDGYPGALSQVLANLIVNADVHAWDPGQSGIIRIMVRLPNPETIQILHEDNGRGIPAEHRNHIFDPFFTTRRSSGSTGLGLNIVYNLMTGPMRGSVRVCGAPGSGTTFVLRFPRALPAEPDAATPPP